MVQKAVLEGCPSRLACACWIIPLSFWFSTTGRPFHEVVSLILRWHSILTVLGIASIATLDRSTPIIGRSSRSLGETILFFAILSNIALNLFATFNIVIRLLHYRKQISASFGPGTRLYGLAKEQLKTTGILLESAALNVPVTLVSAIMLWRGELLFMEVVLQVVIPFQV